MIRELLINNKNMEVFKKLIPEQYQNEIERGSLTAFGFFDDEAMPGEKIAGVVLVRRFGRWIEIEYMSQSDLHAGEMYGAEILDTLIGLIKFSPVDYVGCYTKLYPDETEMHDLFDYVGFKFSKARDGIYEFTFDMVDVDRLVGTEKTLSSVLNLGMPTVNCFPR